MADENDLNINISANPSGVEAGSKRAGAAIKGIAGNTKELEVALNKFRASIDPTFAAMQKFNKAHQENLALLRADIITRKEYNAGMKVAKQAMEAEIEAINRRSAAGRQAAAEERARRQQERADRRAAAQAEVAAAREALAAKRSAERSSREESKRLAREEAQLVRQAAQAARAAAQEKTRAERTAAAEQRRAVSEQRRQEKTDARDAARVVREAARDKAREEKAAAREALAAVRDQKRQERELTRAAVADAKAAAREKLAAERQASREAAQAERDAKTQARTAAREAAQAAKQSARERAQADRDAAKASREAAMEIDRMAKAERAAAKATSELRSSIDPVFASQTRYNETMRTATSLLMQNKLKAGEWIAIQRQAKTQMDVNVRSMGRMNSVGVQMGYQMQDVAASIASGINPAVIFAQQMGQTASAAAQMGGKIGKVAAFFAGPWGAAITIAVLALGYLWDSMSEGEKATKDLMVAEDRRKMSVKELTSAIKDYTAAQREANMETGIAARNEMQQMVDAQHEIEDRITKTTAEIAKYEKIVAGLRPLGANVISGPALLAAEANLLRLRQQLENLKKAHNEQVDAAKAAGVALAKEMASETEEEKKHQRIVTEITDAYTASKGTAADYQIQLKKLTEENERFRLAKEKEAAARRENAAAAREEAKATFHSREQAIGVAGRELRKEGYSVGENNQFGGVHANHPGMGNAAHGKYAIDVNMPGFGKGNPEAANAVARARMDEMVKAYQARGFRVLWNGKVYNAFGNGASYDIPAGDLQHKDHAHIEAPQSIIGKPAGKRLGQELAKDYESAAVQAAKAAIEVLDTKLAMLELDDSKTSEQKLEVVKQIEAERVKIVTEAYGAISKEAEQAKQHELQTIQQYNQRILQNDLQRLRKEQTIAEDRESLRTFKDNSEIENKTADVGFEENNGLSAMNGIMARAQILDLEYQQQQQHEDRMFNLKVEYLRKELALPGQTADRIKEINDAIEIAEAQHLSTMEQMNVQYSNRVRQLQRDAAQVTADKWRGVASTLTSSMGSAFQGLWTKSMTWQQAMLNIADSLVFKFADMGLKMLEDWIVHQVTKGGIDKAAQAAEIATHAGTEAAKTGITAGGEATRTGIKSTAAATETGITTAVTAAKVGSEAIKTAASIGGAAAQTGAAATAGVAEVGTSAAVAAAGAYKSTVVIPFIGPIAAPAAAALALAAVLGFASLISSRGGMGEVGADGQMAVLHAKETVLPAWIAEPMRQMFVSPRSSSGMMSAASTAASSVRSETSMSSAANFYYQPKNNNYDASLDTLLRRDGHTMRKWFMRQLRNGGLKLPQ